MASHSQRVERIAKLIAAPSISSAAPGLDQSNRAVIDVLADQLDAAGFDVEVLPLPNAAHKANLIATFGRGSGGLVLSGHTDTVPFDEGAWSSDPFTLSERDGKLHGLGTSDMKAFLALAIEAAEGLDADRLEAPLIVLATADEETTMDGARALVAMQRPKARYAIVGEPTDMRAARAHKGQIAEQLRVFGSSGHASDPRLGNSALDGMARVMPALIALREQLAARFSSALFAVPQPTLNLGRIHGGDSSNRICAACELDLDLRLLPGMDVDWLRDELARTIELALRGTGLTYTLRSLSPGTPAFELDAEAELVRAVEQLTGEGATSVAFATEAPYLSELGAQTLVFGPGSIAEAHRPDEFVRADRLEPTVQMLRAMAHRLCKAPPR